jgi:hypothetical protein
MNFARTALFLVVLSVSAFGAEGDKMDAAHAVEAAPVEAAQARPETEVVKPEKAKLTYEQHVNACLQTRQDFGAPGTGIAPMLAGNPAR